MKIGIIGTGNLGQSIAKGILQSKVATTLYLSKRNTTALAHFKNRDKVWVTTQNKEVVNHSHILIFAIQPSQMSGVLEEIKGVLTKEHLLVSTVTGYAITKIETFIGPAHSIIRAMPNTAIAVGASMSCLCANTIGEKRVNEAKAIFNSMGHTMVISESKMQAATVICASGIAFWMRLIRAQSQAGVQLGFESNEALEMVVQTALGAARLLQENKSHPEAEIDIVTTPKGCTISGLNEMEHQGLSAALIQGIQKSYEKITQISEA